MSANPIPVALLVIYDKGFKFKYKKYYLQLGLNLIGSHPSCHVQIPLTDGQRIPQKTAKIIITEDLAIVQPIQQGSIHVLSNMKKKNNLMVEIQCGIKYVIQMQKDFIICGRKALMQISPVEQLLQIKEVVNSANFNLNKNNRYGAINQHRKQQNTSKYVLSSQFQATLLIENQNNFQATIPLDNTYRQFQPTQVINDEIQGLFDATLPLDADLAYVAQNYSQKIQAITNSQLKQQIKQSLKQQRSYPLYNDRNFSLNKNKPNKQIINQNSMNKITSQAQLSMPQTIKQDEMPATIKQDYQIMASQANRISSVFPPTIQQNDQDFILQQIKKKTTVLTKSQPAYRQIKIQKFEKMQHRYISSFQQKRNNISVDSFEDLFGGINNLSNSNITVSLKSNNSITSDKDKNKKMIKETHSQHASDHTQKLQSDNEENYDKIKKSMRKTDLKKIDEVQNSQSQKQILKKCYIIGKISKSEQEKLTKLGYQILTQTQVKNMDIQLLLIEGQLKLSKILLLSLIKGIQIKPVSWINNQKNKLSGKLEGFLWENIEKRKGKGKKIFNQNKIFYLQQDLSQQYEKVMTEAGASIIDELIKSKSKLKIHIAVDQKSRQAKQLYEEKKNYKNWSFYGKKMIIQSILMGEQIIDKYKLDSYSF